MTTLKRYTEIELKSCSFSKRYYIVNKKSTQDEWKEYVIKFLSDNYVTKHMRMRMLEEADSRHNTRLKNLIRSLFPTELTTMKSDFGEALCCLTLQDLFSFDVPYYKWANKSSKNTPEHGIDVIAFDFSREIMVLAEAKWRRNSAGLSNAIGSKDGVIEKFENHIDESKIAEELNILIKKIEDKPKYANKIPIILNFLNNFNSSTIKNCAFFALDGSIIPDEKLKKLSKISHLRELIIYCYFIKDIENCTKEIFKRCSNQ